MAVHEYAWRDWMTLFRQSRVVINDEAQTIVFENCIRSKSFWNLLPLRSRSCRFDEIANVKTFRQSEYRCISVETSDAKGIFLDSDVPRFDEFVDRVREIAQADTDEN